jgi:hypothetical protein
MQRVCGAVTFCGPGQGALIVAFDRREDCSETERRLIDAAAQQTALAAHCSLYQAARDTSFSLAKEVELRTAETETQKRFIEAIIDSLPVSLYAVDRDYRVVAWNRNANLANWVFLVVQPSAKRFQSTDKATARVLEQEFSRVFESGRSNESNRRLPPGKVKSGTG